MPRVPGSQSDLTTRHGRSPLTVQSFQVTMWSPYVTTDDGLDRLLRALADPTRRRLLQEIRSAPGLSTSEVAALIPGMTRWGVMKHLELLHRSGLVQMLPDGRRRRHYAEEAALRPLRELVERL